VGLLGAACWVLTEAMCEKSDFFKWFPGHTLWHVLMSAGLLNTLLYGVVLRANNHSATVSFTTSAPARLASVYFFLLPAIALVPAEARTADREQTFCPAALCPSAQRACKRVGGAQGDPEERALRPCAAADPGALEEGSSACVPEVLRC